MRLADKPISVQCALEESAVDWGWERGTLTISLSSVRIHAVVLIHLLIRA
jgi:hypothetical protein